MHLDLADFVAIRYGRENRLVESTGEKFKLSAILHDADQIEAFGMVLLDPVVEDSGEMQGNTDCGKAIQQLQKWEIGFLVSVFDYPAEIADRLMIMYPETEFYLLQTMLLLSSLTRATVKSMKNLTLR